MIELSVVTPAYLEEENLRILLPRLNRVLTHINTSYEIIVIDTIKALDKTEQVCIENKAHYVQRKKGNTFGDAIRTGIAESKGKFVLFMDADGSHTPEFIPELFEKRNHADVIIASRYVAGGVTENAPALIFMSKTVNLVYAVVLGLKCKDVSNSFKLYRSTDLRSLTLKCSNFDIIEEILFKLKKGISDFTIVEVPFSFKKRMFGATKRNLILFMITYGITLTRLFFFGFFQKKIR